MCVHYPLSHLGISVVNSVTREKAGAKECTRGRRKEDIVYSHRGINGWVRFEFVACQMQKLNKIPAPICLRLVTTMHVTCSETKLLGKVLFKSVIFIDTCRALNALFKSNFIQYAITFYTT